MTGISATNTNPHIPEEQVKALQRLVALCLRHQGGGTFPIIDFLMGMHNGHLWRPDVQLLSGRIDDNDFEDVIQVMRLYRASGREPHTFFTDGEKLFRELAAHTQPVKLDSSWGGSLPSP